MIPVSPVFPEENYKEIIVAEDQPEYQNLPVLKVNLEPGAPQPGRLPVVHCGEGVLISRWKLSKEEIELLNKTGDIYMIMHTFGQPVMPHLIQVEKPVFEADKQAIVAVPHNAKYIKLAEEARLKTFLHNCYRCYCEVLVSNSSIENINIEKVYFLCVDCANLAKIDNPDIVESLIPGTLGDLDSALENYENAKLISENESLTVQ